MLGDKLVRVDGVDCMGLVRDDIKRRVLGHADSKIVLEFQRASIFKVSPARSHQKNRMTRVEGDSFGVLSIFPLRALPLHDLLFRRFACVFRHSYCCHWTE